MVRKQGKEKETSDFNRASCCFLDFIYNFGGIFCILGKKGIFYAEAKIKPFIKMLSFLDPRLEKQDSLITLGSYIFNLEATYSIWRHTRDVGWCTQASSRVAVWP